VLLGTLFFRGKTSLNNFAELRPMRMDNSNELNDDEANLAKKGRSK
jgi:hypothetical protein